MISFLSAEYLFDAYPPAISRGAFFYSLGFLFLCIIFAILLQYFFIKHKKPIFNRKFDKYEKELEKKLVDLLFTFGLIGIFLLFFRKIRVPYFQMRFIMMFWLGTVFVWFSSILQNYLTKVPESRALDEKQRKYEKYLEK
ncbi:MAG: hypothetical protein PHZ07_00105 [Patescibacteria group bacterium]|nr:hypothetical protein [Patescibacteria group bacterium]MDD4304136.1 hypothetical protein [Patescibacteria group bacterium]MDD4695167.1 hypothetical protein [Patescibacteria group bacterium]